MVQGPIARGVRRAGLAGISQGTVRDFRGSVQSAEHADPLDGTRQPKTQPRFPWARTRQSQADLELGGVADEVRPRRIPVAAGVDDYGVGGVAMAGDGDVGGAPGRTDAQGGRKLADDGGTAPVMGQIVAAEPPGQASQRTGGGARKP